MSQHIVVFADRWSLYRGACASITEVAISQHIVVFADRWSLYRGACASITEVAMSLPTVVFTQGNFQDRPHSYACIGES